MIKGTMREVKVDLLQPNKWNPNIQSSFMFERERSSIKRFGFIDPITARCIDGGLEIIDGEHRWKAAKEEGLQSVSVIDLGQMSDAEAKALTILLNELRGEADKNKLAGIVVDIVDDLPEFSELLPFDDSTLNGFRELVDFDWTTLDKDNPERSRSGDERGDARAPFVVNLLQEERERVELAIKRAKNGSASDGEALVAVCDAFLRGEPGLHQTAVGEV